MAAILLAQSTTLRLATGIANIAARAPSAMAAGRRRLDEAYPGRFVLGLGVSHDSIIDAYRGTQLGSPMAALERDLAGVRARTRRGTP